MSVSWHSQSGADLPDHVEWLAPAERARLETLRFPKRRADWLLARFTAKRALARLLALGDDPEVLASVEVRPAGDGSPHAFVRGAAAGVEISLSDRAGFAVCVLRRGELAIGCDLELVEPRSEAFVADYLTALERAAVAAAEGAEARHRLANLIWSAKESALKVLRTGLRRDTRDVEVRLHAASVDGWSALSVHALEGTVFPGWWRQYGRFLLTFAAECEESPPRALGEPPALEGAEPLEG
jgi:4'-phosphopantetheinyl transferase